MARPDLSPDLPQLDRANGWIALAPPPDISMLGEVLARLRASGETVHGFVDRATLLAAWIRTPSPLVLLELSPLRLSISVATRDDGGAALRRQVLMPGGARALAAAWLELARATMVQQSRFDPLHDQRHEAQLRTELPQLAATAERDGQAGTLVQTGSGALHLTLTRDQLAAAAAPVLRPLSEALQSLAAANGAGTLLVPASLLEVPGIDDVLAGARFAHMLRFEAVAITGALRLLPEGTSSTTGAVPYHTQLPLLAETAASGLFEPLQVRTQASRVMATHVVYRGHALPLTAAGVVLGREPGESALPLPDGIAGLSRRHCTLRREAGRSQIIDHSSHGSWLDGVRVRGRALLGAGSVLRLGDPGIELQLIAMQAEK